MHQCGHTPPYIKGCWVPPQPRDSEDPSVLPLLTRTICCLVFSCPTSPPFSFSFFLPARFHPLPFLSGLWQLYIILFRDTPERCMCVMWGAHGSVLQRPWGGSPQSDWWGRCRLCSLIHHILYLGFREEEKEKGGQEGGPLSSKNISPVSPPCFLYPPEPKQE